jgi:hypothetical protein
MPKMPKITDGISLREYAPYLNNTPFDNGGPKNSATVRI